MSKKLVFIQNDQTLTTSLKIAETFGKQHKDVLESIRGILAAENSAARIFRESTFENRGKNYPMYYLNRDGFTLLAMGFTGKKALQFKLAYIDAFNKMEKKLEELLAEGNGVKRLETRQHGKISRGAETDAIKNFIEHARRQGCTWEDWYFYSTISIWANIGAGIPKKNGRDNASVHQLNIIDLLEGTVIRKSLD